MITVNNVYCINRIIYTETNDGKQKVTRTSQDEV